jgi:hypothetical protein
LAAAFLLLIYDGTKSIAGKAIIMRPFGDLWNDIHSSSLQALKPAIERFVGGWLWDPVVISVLTAPTWLVLGAIGILMIVLGRKQKPLIGYARD